MATPSYFTEWEDLGDNKNIDSIPDAYASIGAFANLPAEQVANAMSGVFNTFPGGQKGLIQRTNQELLNQRIMDNVLSQLPPVESSGPNINFDLMNFDKNDFRTREAFNRALVASGKVLSDEQQAFNEAQDILSLLKNDIAAAPGYPGFVPPALTAAIQQQESFIEPTPTYGQLARTYEDFIDPSRGAFRTDLGISSPSDMGYFAPSPRRIADYAKDIIDPITGEIIRDLGGPIPTTSELRKLQLRQALGQAEPGTFDLTNPLFNYPGRMSVSDLDILAAQTADQVAAKAPFRIEPDKETTFIQPEAIGYDPQSGTFVGEKYLKDGEYIEPTYTQPQAEDIKEKTQAEKVKEMVEDAGTTEGEWNQQPWVAPNGTVYNWKSDGKGGAIFELPEGKLAFDAMNAMASGQDITSPTGETGGTITVATPTAPPAAAVTAIPGVTATAGAPTIPAGTMTPSATNLFADPYEAALDEFEQYKRYQLSGFPETTMGQRMAVQPSLGYGYQPAMGRYLLGTAGERFIPQEGLSGGGAFASYLRGQPRADLSQIRQEYANLAQALGAYGAAQDVSQLNQPIISYTAAFGTPGEERLKENILSATQAALGGSPVFRRSSLENVYDAMEQQYGADIGARFADFVGRGFGVQGNLPTGNTPIISSDFSGITPGTSGINPYGMIS